MSIWLCKYMNLLFCQRRRNVEGNMALHVGKLSVRGATIWPMDPRHCFQVQGGDNSNQGRQLMITFRQAKKDDFRLPATMQVRRLSIWATGFYNRGRRNLANGGLQVKSTSISNITLQCKGKQLNREMNPNYLPWCREDNFHYRMSGKWYDSIN